MMKELKYTEQNVDIMIKHEEAMKNVHNKLFQQYQKDFEGFGVELTISFYWQKSDPQKPFFNSEWESQYTRPEIVPGHYSFLVQYAVMKDERPVYDLSPEGEEYGEDLYMDRCISYLAKGFFSSHHMIELYDEGGTADKLNDLLYKLKNFPFDNKDRSEILI